jgi:hypothetical protein
MPVNENAGIRLSTIDGFAVCFSKLSELRSELGDPRQLETWYVGHSVEPTAAKIPVTDLRAATTRISNGLAAQANRVFTHWLREISEPGRDFSRT